jgi:hypothetical protein
MSGKKTFFEGSLGGQMLGPLLLIPVLLLTGRYHPLLNCDLWVIAALGLFLCATQQLRGYLIALGLLVMSAFIKHCCIDAHHLFQVCLECSLAFSLLLTSLISQEAVVSSETLQEQITRRAETIQFLEDDLGKQREKAAEEASLNQKKLLESQEQIEDIQTELSALQILNEVLRKSTAQALVKEDQLSAELKSSECRTGFLLEEIDSLQTELHRLSNTSSLAEQNRDLFKELNAARNKAMQTNLINETLARMHAEVHKELQRKTEECLALAQQKPEPIQLAQSSEPVRIDEIVSKKLAHSEKIEALHRQLQEQFTQKDLVLQQTRSQLFHADTEVQRLQKELSEKQIQEDPLPTPIRKDLENLEEEKAHLLEENLHLTELITHLMASSKKKGKTASAQKKTLASR